MRENYTDMNRMNRILLTWRLKSKEPLIVRKWEPILVSMKYLNLILSLNFIPCRSHVFLLTCAWGEGDN